jgi:phosphate acetyltransferase
MVLSVPNCELGDEGTFIVSDPAITPNPDADNLAEIAIAPPNPIRPCPGRNARIAMLSYSTYGSAKGEIVEKCKTRWKLAKERAPQFNIDGEMQADAALIEKVGQLKAPGSPVAGKRTSRFPGFERRQHRYKLVKRLAKAPLTADPPGHQKPVNDLSRGCSSDDIVGVIAITADRYKAPNNLAK